MNCIQSCDDISHTVPGVRINGGASEGVTNIVIRGVNSTTVGLSIADVSITTKNFYNGAAQPRLFDLERLEVLRGLQGTLYSSSSEGSTVRCISKQPDLAQWTCNFTSDYSQAEHGGGHHPKSGHAVFRIAQSFIEPRPHAGIERPQCLGGLSHRVDEYH